MSRVKSVSTSSTPPKYSGEWTVTEDKLIPAKTACSRCDSPLRPDPAQSECFECRKETLYLSLRKDADQELIELSNGHRDLLKTLARQQEERALLGYRRERLSQNIATLVRQAIEQQRSYDLRAEHWKAELHRREATLKKQQQLLHDLKIEAMLTSLEAVSLQEHAKVIEKESTKATANLNQARQHLDLQESINERLKEEFASLQSEESFSLLSIIDDESDLLIYQSELTQHMLEYLQKLKERDDTEHTLNDKRVLLKLLRAQEDRLKKVPKQSQTASLQQVEKLRLELEECKCERERLQLEAELADTSSSQIEQCSVRSVASSEALSQSVCCCLQ